ncbi:MAG: NUDIX hydrolase [Alistipes indistinctus]
MVSDDIEQVFADFRASQRFIEAGGGVTADPQGNLLLIFRNGRWDLPKGKLEPGERIEDCAVREVGEECGLSGLQLGAFVAHTYHCYRMHGEWVLKRTSWYRMRYGGSQRPQPQTVEELPKRYGAAGGTDSETGEHHFTIRDVLTAAGYVK